MNARAPSLTLQATPLTFLTTCFFLTMVVLLWLGWQTYSSYRLVRDLTQRNLKIEELRGVIIHLDEVLTMSARMTAVTGRPWWEQRYRSYEPILDAAIKAAMTLSPAAAHYAGASQTDEANIKLVEMAHRAFDLVHQNRLEDARGVMFSPDYETQKRIYADGMSQMDAQLKKTQAALFASSRRQALLNMAMAGGVLVLLLIAWIGILNMVRRWQAALLEQQRLLVQQSDSLAQLNQTLDQKVAQRTEQLSREVSQRRQAEETARLYLDVVNNTQVGVVVLRLEHLDDPRTFRLVASNPAAARIVGFPLEREIGKTIAEISPAMLETALPKQYAEVARAGKAQDLGEIRYGDERIAEGVFAVKAFPLPNQCVGLVFENVTARKEAERLLQTTNDQLAAKIKEMELLNRIMMNREERILELKEELKTLRQQTPPKTPGGS